MKTNLQRIVSKYKGLAPQIAQKLNVNQSWVYRVLKQDTTNTNPNTINKIYEVLLILKPNDIGDMTGDELFSRNK